MPRHEGFIAHLPRRQIPYKYSQEDFERTVATKPTWLLPVYGTLFPKVEDSRVLHLMAGSGVELPISREYFGPSARIFATDNNPKVFGEEGDLSRNSAKTNSECLNIDVSYIQAQDALVKRMGGAPQAIILRHPQLFDSLTTQSPLPNAMIAVSRWIAAAKSWGAQMLLTLQDESESNAIEMELSRARYRIDQDFRRLKLPDTPALHYRFSSAHLDRFCKLFL